MIRILPLGICGLFLFISAQGFCAEPFWYPADPPVFPPVSQDLLDSPVLSPLKNDPGRCAQVVAGIQERLGVANADVARANQEHKDKKPSVLLAPVRWLRDRLSRRLRIANETPRGATILYEPQTAPSGFLRDPKTGKPIPIVNMAPAAVVGSVTLTPVPTPPPPSKPAGSPVVTNAEAAVDAAAAGPSPTPDAGSQHLTHDQIVALCKSYGWVLPQGNITMLDRPPLQFEPGPRPGDGISIGTPGLFNPPGVFGGPTLDPGLVGSAPWNSVPAGPILRVIPPVSVDIGTKTDGGDDSEPTPLPGMGNGSTPFPPNLWAGTNLNPFAALMGTIIFERPLVYPSRSDALKRVRQWLKKYGDYKKELRDLLRREQEFQIAIYFIDQLIAEGIENIHGVFLFPTLEYESDDSDVMKVSFDKADSTSHLTNLDIENLGDEGSAKGINLKALRGRLIKAFFADPTPTLTMGFLVRGLVRKRMFEQATLRDNLYFLREMLLRKLGAAFVDAEKSDFTKDDEALLKETEDLLKKRELEPRSDMIERTKYLALKYEFDILRSRARRNRLEQPVRNFSHVVLDWARKNGAFGKDKPVPQWLTTTLKWAIPFIISGGAYGGYQYYQVMQLRRLEDQVIKGSPREAEIALQELRERKFADVLDILRISPDEFSKNPELAKKLDELADFERELAQKRDAFAERGTIADLLVRESAMTDVRTDILAEESESVFASRAAQLLCAHGMCAPEYESSLESALAHSTPENPAPEIQTFAISNNADLVQEIRDWVQMRAEFRAQRAEAERDNTGEPALTTAHKIVLIHAANRLVELLHRIPVPPPK